MMGAKLGSTHKIPLAYDPDQSAVLIDNGKRADPMCNQQCRNLLHCGRGSNGDHVDGHDLAGFHAGHSH